MTHDHDETMIGPVDLKGQLLGAGPHALVIHDDEITLTKLPGRARLWLIVLPTVFIAWNLQPHIPDPLPPTLTYILIVLAAFYAGDRWSHHATQQRLNELTPQDATEQATTRIHLPQLEHAHTQQPLFGDIDLTLQTPTETHQIALTHDQHAQLEPHLEPYTTPEP